LTIPIFGVFFCIVNVMAAVSITVCWLAFIAVWLITAQYVLGLMWSAVPAVREGH
jgi:hypothetical protein